jgi:CubicO group peptidase (beta-lactamase class C family)
MAHDSIFRIFSMTKPIVSVGIMMLVEDGHFVLNDPVAKFIPEFAEQKVGVENNGKLDLVPVKRQMTVQDLLRHTSGLTYDHTGNGSVQQLYQQSRLRSRKITNAEHATMIAGMPLICQPGAEWNYSRSTDVLGRIIEVVSGKSLGAFLTERILAPLQMAETAFHTPEANAGRLAEPFATDPWNGDKVQLFNMLEKPAMESGGGGLVSTTMDYARFCQMLLNGGALDGEQDHRPQDAGADGLRSSLREREGRLAADAARPRFWPRLRGPHPPRRRPVPGLAGPVLLERHGRHVLLHRSRGRPVHGVHDAGPRPARIYPEYAAGSGVRRGGVRRGVRGSTPTSTVMPREGGASSTP